MMKTIVEEKLVSFKELEQKIFKYVCELGCEITRVLLERYDMELAASRDPKQYRDKGKRNTCIKTVYGSVVIKDADVILPKDGETIGRCPVCDAEVKEKNKGYFCMPAYLLQV